ncbi:MAG: AAA family ATPase [Desulfonauticus sp.]|nr:AAA family ATPase [Desulfonauticus sp.]
MLEYFRYKNFAFLEDAELELSSGLNVFTGETGSGKSLFLKALSGLLGDSLKNTQDAQDKSVLEGIFYVDEEEVIVRREISNKRSRFFFNDELASVNKIKQFREKVFLYVTQHGQQKLIRPSLATELVDEFVSNELIWARGELVKKLEKFLSQKEELEQKIQELEQKQEFLAYQRAEIDKVNPRSGEEEELLERVKILKQQQQKGEALLKLGEILKERNFFSSLRELIDGLKKLSSDPEFSAYFQEAENFFYTVQELEGKIAKSEFSSVQEIDNLEKRLYELSLLKRKFNKSLDEILELRQNIEEDFSFLDASKLDLKKLEKNIQETAQKLKEIITRLNATRLEKSKQLACQLKQELAELGFNKALQIHFKPYTTFIFDQIEEIKLQLFWQPNPGVPLEPLSKIASGGELSRVLLALMSIKGEGKGVVVFDEIDTGIGGITLEKIGEKIKQLARHQQVILVTHWPQLAVLAHKHFKVEKQIQNGQTVIRCYELKDKQARKKELARMAGGGKKGEVLAEMLLEGNKNV